MKRVRQAVLCLIGLILIAFAALLVVAQIQQRILKVRTDRLLREFTELQLREATFDDAQRLREEWSRFANVKQPCSPNHCVIEFTLSDSNDWKAKLITINYKTEVGAWPYLLLGGRPARVRAELEVRNGRVWGKDFSVWVYVRGRSVFTALPGYSLMVNTGTQSSFHAYDYLDPRVVVHPNYIVGSPGGCTMCIAAYAFFTPYADPSDVERLMRINTGCLTSWRPCNTQADILPDAWRQVEAEREQVRKFDPDCGGPNINFLLGRDGENVAVIRILSVSPSQDEARRVRARMVSPLKRSKSWEVGAESEFEVRTHNLGEPGMKLRTGEDYVLFFNHSKPVVTYCGLVPATEANLNAAQNGVEQDFRAGDSEH